MSDVILQKLRSLLTTHQLEAFWVSKPENVRYLSGFSSPRDAKILVTHDRAVLYTDARYTLQARDESRLPTYIAQQSGAARLVEVLDNAAKVVNGKAVGFEEDDLPYGSYAQFFDVWKAKLVPTHGLIEGLRSVKALEEIQIIRQAARIADEALAAIADMFVVGRSERQIALQLEIEMRMRGAEAVAFEFIVASGERGAMPHGVASNRALQDGDLVTVDCGALFNGYHSDITRAFAVGVLAPEMLEIHRVVREAHQAALNVVRAGVRCADVDQAARDVIVAAGFGEAFVHGVGHGVGLAIHEMPTLSQSSQAVLEAGNVVTVEPGIYLAGKGGVRLEDLLLVTDTGFEYLSNAPKQSIS